MSEALNESEQRAIRHALGLAKRGKAHRRWAYRNYYAAADSATPLWRSLEARGYARYIAPPNDLHPYFTFVVTQAGIEAAGLAAYVPRSVMFNYIQAPPESEAK